MKNQLKVLGAAMAIVVASALASAVNADDKIIMNDGRVFEGTIVREVNGYVFIQMGTGSLARQELLLMSDIKEILRDTPAVEVQAEPTKVASALTIAGKTAPANTKPDTKPVASTSGKATKAAIITLGETGKDMVGLFMTAHVLEEIKPVLQKEGVEIVVFLINSGGGALSEIQKLSDVIQEDYKNDFRTVAWIESAISAAAMTAHCIEEIYFMPEGNYGACTGYRGALDAMKGRELEEVIFMMEKISVRGSHKDDGAIMRSMQHFDYPLSCNIDENGDISWHQNEEGEFLVNPEGRILTFDSETALKYNFSDGTAETLEELEAVMQIGEIEWVGEDVKGFFYPISKAEAINMRFRAKTFDDQERTNEYFVIYGAAIQLASAEQEKQRRGMFVGKARTQLNSIIAMVRNNPNLALFVMNMNDEQFEQWVAEQRQLLKDLMR